MSEFPGAPEWLQDFYARMESRDEVLVERFRGIVRAEVAPALAQLEVAIDQVRGYGKVVGESMAKIERLENQLQSLLHAPRPPAKTTPSAPGRPRLVKAQDHSSTIPAPPDGDGDDDA